ncbi:MAG TPA: aminotransferase class IV, partial [Candidatus Polarisedimenticolia bacterium]|nr:aminotransferase class IV [Candidatus Polarisedimenticolia bacterium]
MSVQPFDDRNGVIWFDGKLVDWRDAKVHILTHAMHYASAVFEGERVYEGKVFRLTDHSQRLLRSAELLGFKIPYSLAEIDSATNETVKRSGFKD